MPANDGLGSGSIARRSAAGPSAECMTKVRSLAESDKVRYVFHAKFRGTKIFLCEVAADVIENLRKRRTLGVKLSIERAHGCGDLPGYTLHAR